MIYGFKETAVVLEHMISGVVQGYRSSTELKSSTGIQK
jgi:hypothetical protein